MGRAGSASAMPTAVDTTPSMPLAPRLACTDTSASGAARTTRGRGRASTTTPPVPRRRAGSPPAPPPSAGSVGSASLASVAATAARGRVAVRPPRRRPGAVGHRHDGVRLEQPVIDEVGGGDREDDRRRAVGVVPAVRSVGDDLDRAGRRQPLADHPGGERAAEAHDHLRAQRVELEAQERVRSRHHGGIGLAPHRCLRGRPASASPVRRRRGRAPPPVLTPAPATITPRRPARSSRRPTAGAAGRPGSGRHAHAPPLGRGPAAASPALPEERLAEGEVEVDRARPTGRRSRRRPGPPIARQRRARGLVGRRPARGTTAPTDRRGGSGRWPAAHRRRGAPADDRRCTRAAAPRRGRASTTAAWSSAAAVPLVREHDGRLAGRRARCPRARNAAAALVVVDVDRRSARRRPVRARAASSASRGRRRRGARRRAPTRRRAWRRRWPGGPRVGAPSRPHPSTRRVPGSTPWSCTPSATGSGPPIVLVHGFTQTARCWGAEADRPGRATTRSCRRTRPATAAPRDVTADLVTGGRPMLAEAGGPATYLGYSMGARFVPPRRPRTTRSVVRGLVLVGGTAGIEDDERSAPSGTTQDLRTAQRIERRRTRRLPRRLARPAAVRRPAAGSPVPGRAAAATPSTGLAASLEHRRHGRAGAVVGRAAGARRCRSSSLAGADDAKFAALGRADGRRDRRQRRRSRSSPAPATPPTSSNPSASSRSCAPGSPATACSERSARLRTDPEPEGEEAAA